jgi:RNA recognition motif-containing protein
LISFVFHGKSISSNFEIPGKLLPSELLSSKKIEEIGRVKNKTFSNSSNQNITFETSVNNDKEVNETFVDTGENNMIKQVDSNMKYNHILNGKDQSSSKLANVFRSWKKLICHEAQLQMYSTSCLYPH